MKILLFQSPTESSNKMASDFATMVAAGLKDRAITEYADTIASVKNTDADVVHAIGHWSATLAKALSTAATRHIPTLYTPLGGLEPWNFPDKTMATATKLKSVCSHISAIHACGKLEKDNILKTNLNKRVQVIGNPIVTSRISYLSMTEKLLLFYQKIIDSNAFARIDSATLKFICQALRASTDTIALKDKAFRQEVDETSKKYARIDWRYIFLYANAEHFLADLKEGLTKLKIDFPQIDVNAIDCFDAERNYIDDSLNCKELISKSLIVRKKIEEWDGEGKELDLARALLNMQHEINNRRLPFSHLLDFYRYALLSDYDEDKFVTIIDDLKITEFTQRIFAILADLFDLPEGFQPIEPIDDKKTRTIKRKIAKIVRE